MATNKSQRQVRLDDELYLKVKFIANENSRSWNNQIEVILKNAVKEYEAVHGEIVINPDDLYV